ncbi:hypothetical protein D3C72_2470210 [compost metagenome]
MAGTSKQPLADPTQHQIPEGMTHGIVNILEIIDIQEQQGCLPLCLPGKMAVHLFHQGQLVGQS